MLKKWISTHKYDFEMRSISKLVHEFIDNVLKLSGHERVADQLNSQFTSLSLRQPMPCPEVIKLTKKDFDLLDIDPLELARQITLDDVIVYQSLEARDFLNCAWSNKGAGYAPTIKAMISNFNCTAEWVQGYLLNQADDSYRAKCIRHFVATANELLKLNNFNGSLKIVGGLTGQSLFRLTHTWDKVPKDDVKRLEELRGLMLENWAGLRELMASVPPPSIPVISPFLGDLTYVNEMKTTKNSMVNFKKITLEALAIEKVMKNVDYHYWFTEVPEIKRWIKNNENIFRLDDNAAYQKSLSIQPRGKGK